MTSMTYVNMVFLKKPQDLSNQASNCKFINNIILNFKIKFKKKLHLPFINFENPLYIEYSISE
jgi:hypothetical protein